MDKLSIPRPLQVIMDDVGWFNGRDDRKIGGPSRTGLNRYHFLEDYMAIEEFGTMLGQKINCAFVMGEWDIENVLPRKIKHFSHFGDSWDNAKYRDPNEMAQIAEFVSGAEHIDVALHGLYHGYYMPGVDNHDLSDYYYRINKELFMVDADEIRTRIDTFLEMLIKYGIKKEVNSFVPPSGAYRVNELSAILREFGILYVTLPFRVMTPKIEDPDETVFIENDIISSNRYEQKALPWFGYDLDFDNAIIPNGIQGTHWPNILNMDPKRNSESVAKTRGFFTRGADRFDLVITRDVAECSTQYLYEKYTKVTQDGNEYTFDFSEVPYATGRLGYFVVNVKGRISAADGCAYEVYGRRRDFTNYTLKLEGNTAKIRIE